jgi:hypothetical protein
MAVSMTTRLTMTVLTELGVTGDLVPGGQPILAKLEGVNVLRNGTATLQADKIFQDTGSIVGSATTSLDLSGGALVDPLGATLAFAKVKALAVRARDTNNVANNLLLTRPAANGVPIFSAASDAIPLHPGSIFMATWPGAGIAVTADTGDLISLINGAATNTIDYDIVIIGTSA